LERFTLNFFSLFLENKPEQTQQNAADKAVADKAAAENQAAALALIGKADQRIAQAKEDVIHDFYLCFIFIVFI
jgi:hypothetical protein